MNKSKLKFSNAWKSKLTDLIIVIVGITIAFQLNNWNESNKQNLKARNYIESFYQENILNEAQLVSALEFSISNEKEIGTLKQILLSKNYLDDNIKILAASMMSMASYNPYITTMENITASGEFELIKDVELRKQIISTYNTNDLTLKVETILSEYINKYLTPYLFENVRFTDFSSIHGDFIKDPEFENIVFGYGVLLKQQITGYQENLKRMKQLNNTLSIAKNDYKK